MQVKAGLTATDGAFDKATFCFFQHVRSEKLPKTRTPIRVRATASLAEFLI